MNADKNKRRLNDTNSDATPDSDIMSARETVSARDAMADGD